MATATFYPATGSGGVSVDGYADYYTGSYHTLAQIRGYTGNGSGTADTNCPVGANTGVGQAYAGLWRSLLSFDTSSLPDDCTITGATLGVYTYVLQNDGSWSNTYWGLSLVGATLTNYNQVANGDYNQLGATRLAPDLGFSTLINGVNTFTLNATGLAGISKTGVTEFGVTFPADVDNSNPTTVNGWQLIRFYTADNGSNKPTLTVTYTTTTPITAIGATTGTTKAGSTLTAGSLTPGGATATYQWQRCSTSGGTYASIAGATSTTYTPVSGDEAYYIEVVATGSGSYSGTVTSSPVGPITSDYTDVCAVNDKVSVITQIGGAAVDVCAVSDKVSVLTTGAEIEPIDAAINDKVSVVASDAQAGSATSAVNDKVSVVASGAEVEALTTAISDKVSVTAGSVLATANLAAINDKVSVVVTGAEIEPIVAEINDKVSVSAALIYIITATVNDKVSVTASNAQADTATAGVNDKVSVVAADVYIPVNRYVETVAVEDKVSVVARSVQVSSTTASISDKVSVTAAPSVGTTRVASINDKVIVTFTDRSGNSIVTAVCDKVNVVTTDIFGGSAVSAINDKVSVVASNFTAVGIIAAVNDRVRVFAANRIFSKFAGTPQYIDWTIEDAIQIDWVIEDARQVDWAIEYIMQMDWSL